MFKRILIFVLLLPGLILASSVWAITYGLPDGERHPNVGALAATVPSLGVTFPYCSGTLIAPTVFLTAAHCDVSSFTGTNAVMITFDSEIAPVYNPTTYTGTFIRDPRYTWRQDDAHDIAVVILDAPINHISPAALPAAGSLDALRVGEAFTAVGYGADEPVVGAGGPPVNAYLDVREYSVATLNAINKAWLRLSQNPATGDGGTCYGDSGGPNFLGAGADETNIIAGITITGDSTCRSTNVIYRLDTEAARSFLSQFVALP